MSEEIRNGLGEVVATRHDAPLSARKVTLGHELTKTEPISGEPHRVRWHCSCSATGTSHNMHVGEGYANHLPDMPREVRPETPVKPDASPEPTLSKVFVREYHFANSSDPLIVSGKHDNYVDSSYKYLDGYKMYRQVVFRRENVLLQTVSSQDELVVHHSNLLYEVSGIRNVVNREDFDRHLREINRWGRPGQF